MVSTSKSRATNRSAALHCFATHTEDHNDATRLEQIGVWLGDYNEEAATVNGVSQNEVEKSYFESTAGGIDCSKAEPYVFDQFSAEQYAVECAACKTSPSTATERFSLEVIEFSWVDDDESCAEERTHIQKHAWIYRCRLGEREVFAFVKPLPEREAKRVDSHTALWSFWKLDGGYTSRSLLATMHSDATTPLLRPDVVPVASGTGTQTWTTTAARTSTIPLETTGPWACLRGKPSMSGSEVRKETATDPRGLKSQALRGGPAMRSSLNGVHHDEYEQHPVNKRRRLSFDSMYDVTPSEQRNGLPGNKPTTEPIVERRESSSRLLANSRPDPGETSQSDGSGASFTTTRFKVWFTFDSSVGAACRVVILDDSLSFDAAFAHIKAKLARKMNGKGLAAVVFKFDTGTMLEVDEEATWQEVVEMVKETGKAELEGTVDLE
ncbi:hypothetical protein Slin14017_G090680 [Septoria linicola]|nr:hypothetical protein Slin14017_G090680 [Septoria linicola]